MRSRIDKKVSLKKTNEKIDFLNSNLLKEGLGSVAVRVSEKIEKDMFDSILKMSKKVKKKKGKKKKVTITQNFILMNHNY